MREKKRIPAIMIVLATFAGGALGTAAGLLLAPHSGKKTQERIRETYASAVERLNGSMQKIDDRVSALVAKGTSDVKGVPHQVKGQVISIVQEAGNSFNTSVEKGTLKVIAVAETVSHSLKAGKKKYMEKKQEYSAID